VPTTENAENCIASELMHPERQDGAITVMSYLRPTCVLLVFVNSRV